MLAYRVGRKIFESYERSPPLATLAVCILPFHDLLASPVGSTHVTSETRDVGVVVPKMIVARVVLDL